MHRGPPRNTLNPFGSRALPLSQDAQGPTEKDFPLPPVHLATGYCPLPYEFRHMEKSLSPFQTCFLNEVTTVASQHFASQLHWLIVSQQPDLSSINDVNPIRVAS